MNKTYKEFIVKKLYGAIQTSPEPLKDSIIRGFSDTFKNISYSIDVESTDKLIKDKENNNLWIGTITVSLKVDGEEYKLTRHFEEEYVNDTNHPNYETDDWFYESEECFSFKKYQEILKSFD